jgi:hypothetical protein
VIVANFKQPLAPEQADLDEVKALARKAAIILGRYTGTTVLVKQVSVSAFGAFVPGHGSFRLGIVVGSYSKVRGMPIGGDPREWAKMRDAAPRELRVEVVADVEWLRDHELATTGDTGEEYTDPEFKTVREAADWVEKNCLKVPVARVSQKEIAKWDSTTITVAVGCEDERKMTLLEAVKVYGSLYRYEISLEVLEANHGIAAGDAKLIVTAVMKNLPRKNKK